MRKRLEDLFKDRAERIEEYRTLDKISSIHTTNHTEKLKEKILSEIEDLDEKISKYPL